MYGIFTANSRTRKNIEKHISERKSIKDKLIKLRENPRKSNGAHSLHGRLSGKWSCWLGSDIRIVYSIDDKTKKIIIEAVGSHKIY